MFNTGLPLNSKPALQIDYPQPSAEHERLAFRLLGSGELRVSGLSSRRAKRGPKLAAEILRYFVRNPKACDNLEGVTRWRLADERIYETVQTTKDALEWLVAQGFLLKESKPWCGDIYRLNARMLKKADSSSTGEAGQTRDGNEK